MNKEIEEIFKNFIVDKEKIPVSFLNYKGKSDTYVIYKSLGEEPIFHGDNTVLVSDNTYDFHIYKKGNFLNILKELKNRLKNNGWTWLGDSEDFYEEDTDYFHKVTTFEKERCLWQELV